MNRDSNSGPPLMNRDILTIVPNYLFVLLILKINITYIYFAHATSVPCSLVYYLRDLSSCDIMTFYYVVFMALCFIMLVVT